MIIRLDDDHGPVITRNSPVAPLFRKGYGSIRMSRYIRRCPKCGDCLALVVNEPPEQGSVLPIYGYCLACGYRIRGWRLILGRKQIARRKLPFAKGIQIE
jgi:hypothetical protein